MLLNLTFRDVKKNDNFNGAQRRCDDTDRRLHLVHSTWSACFTHCYQESYKILKATIRLPGCCMDLSPIGAHFRVCLTVLIVGL